MAFTYGNFKCDTLDELKQLVNMEFTTEQSVLTIATTTSQLKAPEKTIYKEHPRFPDYLFGDQGGDAVILHSRTRRPVKLYWHKNRLKVKIPDIDGVTRDMVAAGLILQAHGNPMPEENTDGKWPVSYHNNNPKDLRIMNMSWAATRSG